jgi:hypothetical protein
LACLMIPAHLNQVSRTSSRNRTKRVPPNSDFGLWGRSCIGKLAKLCKVDNFAKITTLWILSETRMLQALVAPRPNSQDERRFERM